MRSAAAPDSTGVPVAEFNEFCRNRQKHGHTLNATSTHDTKRAEDVRARINVLSEVPAAWDKKLQQWARWNMPKKEVVNGQRVPDPNEEVLLYQTMLGAWPLEVGEVSGFRKRLQEYMVKALREAMVHTNWAFPDVRHERALSTLLSPSLRNRKITSFFPTSFACIGRSCLLRGAQFSRPAIAENHDSGSPGFLPRIGALGLAISRSR